MDRWELVARKTYRNGMIELPCEETERLRVPGGWLYRVVLDNDPCAAGRSLALTFVPEPSLGDSVTEFVATLSDAESEAVLQKAGL